MVRVLGWEHPASKLLLDTWRIFKSIHLPWSHSFSMSLAIGSWLNKNSQRWYLLQEVFVILVVFLHSLLFLWCWLLFFIHCCFFDVGCCSSIIAVFVMVVVVLFHCFSTSSLTLPWAIARFLHLFYTFSPAHSRVIHNTFILTFPGPSFSFTASATVLSGHFLRRFLPYAPSPHFCHNLLLSRPPWELAIPFWNLQGFMLILETQTWPICSFDSQQSTILIFRRICI